MTPGSLGGADLESGVGGETRRAPAPCHPRALLLARRRFQGCKSAQRSYWAHANKVEMCKRNKKLQARAAPRAEQLWDRLCANTRMNVCSLGRTPWKETQPPAGAQEGVTFSWLALPACSILLQISSHPFISQEP